MATRQSAWRAAPVRPVGDPDSVPIGTALSLAGATDFGDLLRRIAELLESETALAASVTLWLFETDGPVPLIHHPPGNESPRTATADISRAVAAPVTHYEDADCVCLTTEDQTFGVLEIRPAGLRDARRLREIAAVAGARLGSLITVQRQRERLPGVPMSEDAREIQEVISAFAAQAKQLLDHDRLSIYLLTPDRSALERFAVATSPVIPGEGDIIPLEQVGLARVVNTNQALVSADFGEDNRILGLEDSIVSRAGFCGLVSVPLRNAGKPFGILNFVSKTRNFYSELDIPIAQQIADEASVFLQNLRLQHDVRAAVEREAIARERNRVAREFHDTLAQALALISARASTLAEAEPLDVASARTHAGAIAELSGKALEAARRSLNDLLPSELDEATLVEAIDQALVRLHDESGLATSLHTAGNASALAKNRQAVVYRIFSEAINNTRRHAEAASIAVSLVALDGELHMSVTDDGRGIATASPEASDRGGFGIEMMR